MSSATYFKYWGKVEKDSEQADIGYHLLPYHCLDVAAVADKWLTRSNVLLKQISAHIGKTEQEARSIVLFFVLLHDFGKFDARFQNFVESIRIKLQGNEYEVESEAYSHGSFGYLHFRKVHGNNEAMKAVAGHHGYCDVSLDPFSPEAEPDADDELIELDKHAREEWVKFCLEWTGLSQIPDVGEIPMLAGLCSVSDWIGSSITNFTQEPDLDLYQYYKQILPKADAALIESGMVQVLSGAGFEFLFNGYTPRGIQTLIEQIPQQPGLTIVESDTGSGKTEFALAYASRLIENKLADGIVFGLPTQATANGLFDRIGDAAEKLFPDSTVTLAHGKSRYILKDKYLSPDENGFLHRSNKRAFLGSMSVATVDQILMGVLSIKHQFIRSFGTRKSVLILDEIHSFDAYMYGLIEQVLKGQHQAFSSVILLSATLPNTQKNKLLRPYGGSTQSDCYPLITHTSVEGETNEFTLTTGTVRKQIKAEKWCSATLLPNQQQQQQLLNWAMKGAMVGVICNTVNDAQKLYLSLQEVLPKDQGPELDIDIFHARYTFADRAKIEKSVLNVYGKNAPRKGRILIATQVVEQSLDLDFDVMVSQIAPIEFLMQRMGRLWRHDRVDSELAKRTISVNEPVFITLIPSTKASDWKTHYQGSGFVYRNIRSLYRTEQYLHEHQVLTFPDCYREAIEYVHAEQMFAEEPEALESLFNEYQDSNSASSYVAKMNANLESKPLSDVDPRCALLTREGEMTVSVVLVDEHGKLLHGGDYQEQQDRELSTVSIAKKHVRGIQDADYYCVKATVGQDIDYTELGVILPKN
ncbi:CRISPR-associated helicase/endonuclease Cas3 [Photobacterium profundum]|nr:CRISPR-associated helicase/endonuclease Cas3 [Photobacterium profundum]